MILRGALPGRKPATFASTRNSLYFLSRRDWTSSLLHGDLDVFLARPHVADIDCLIELFGFFFFLVSPVRRPLRARLNDRAGGLFSRLNDRAGGLFTLAQRPCRRPLQPGSTTVPASSVRGSSGLVSSVMRNAPTRS